MRLISKTKSKITLLSFFLKSITYKGCVMRHKCVGTVFFSPNISWIKQQKAFCVAEYAKMSIIVPYNFCGYFWVDPYNKNSIKRW